MFIKPEGYDEARAAGGQYSRLETGGHILVISDIEHIEKGNWQALEITFETTRKDKQPEFFAKKREELGNPDAYVGDNFRLFLPSGDPEDQMYKRNVRNVKSFFTSLEESNPGFKYDWKDDRGEKQVIGKIIGGVFGEEEYRANNGDIRTSVKLRWFRSVDGALEADPPKIKELRDKPAPASVSGNIDLPFDL